MTKDDLKSWYLFYNKKFFNNELPVDCEVYWKKPLSRHDAASLNKYTDTGRPVIYIRPLFYEAEMYFCLLLLHEMIHLLLKIRGCPKRIYSGHGKEFKAEQKRLEEIGAVRPLW